MPPILLEAMLFASGEPIEKKRAAALLGLSATEMDQTAETLRAELVGRGLVLMETEHALELRTAPEAAGVVRQFTESEFSRDLGKAGLEALAIILYRGSATRGEIDWVRGVNSSATVRALMLRGLIEGEEDTHGRRRIRYRATTDALAHLGVSRADALPRYTEFTTALAETEREERAQEGEAVA